MEGEEGGEREKKKKGREDRRRRTEGEKDEGGMHAGCMQHWIDAYILLDISCTGAGIAS